MRPILLSAFLFGFVAHTSPIAKTAPPVNSGTVKLIEGTEGFRSNFYYAVDGSQIIGYGHNCTRRKDCKKLSTPITRSQGDTLLKSDLDVFESCVCALPNSQSLNANQYGALVSFAHNAGCGTLSTEFSSYMQKEDFKGVCSILPTTDTNGGQFRLRRQKEGKLCSRPTSALSGCLSGAPYTPQVKEGSSSQKGAAHSGSSNLCLEGTSEGCSFDAPE